MTEKKPPVQPTPRRERRSRSAEEDSKALAWKLLKEELDKDPQARERYIAKVTGFDIAKARREAIEEESHLEFLKLGLKEIQKEPDWAKELARDAIYEAMGKKPPEPEEARPRETPEQFMERMLKVKDFIERMTPKPPGFWEQVSSAFTPENLTMLFKSMNYWFSQQTRTQNPSPSGANSSQTPPHQTTEEQTTASGFAGFGYEPPPAPPNAQGETNRPNAASYFDSRPEYRNETNPNPDQSPSPASEARAANPEAGAEPPQDETINTLKRNDESRPTGPGEIWLSKLNAKAAKARIQRVNQTSGEPPMPQPGLQEKAESEIEVESPLGGTLPPPHARPKRAEPFHDLDPDPTPEDLEKLDKRSD